IRRIQVQFLTLQHEGWAEPGVLCGGRATGLKDAGFDDLLSVISGGADALDRVSRWLYSQPRSESLDLAATPLRAPIPTPPKIVCIGLNYRGPNEEDDGRRGALWDGQESGPQRLYRCRQN